MDVGHRVVRGPDWNSGDKDGGEGHVGTVVRILTNSESSSLSGKIALIMWDSGYVSHHKIGHENSYELRIVDNAAVGIKHLLVKCDSCMKWDISGTRWKCRQCDDFDLCTQCYFADEHDLTHPFYRIEFMGASRVEMPKRQGAVKLEMKGIFPCAKVFRGPDWCYDNQDGGEEERRQAGEVLDVANGLNIVPPGGVVAVTWSTGNTNIYRLGYKGKVDLVCSEESVGGYYYRDHLPLLGKSEVETDKREKMILSRVGDILRCSDHPNLVTEAEICELSPACLEFTWKIRNFLDLPPSEAIICPRIYIPGAMVTAIMTDHETCVKQSSISFVVAFCSYECITCPEMHCELALKNTDGTLCKSLNNELKDTLTEHRAVFVRYFDLSKFNCRKESLIPEGVLTVCINLRFKRNASEQASAPRREPSIGTESVSEQSAPRDNDTDLASDLSRLHVGGDKEVTFKIKQQRFKTFTSILEVRVPTFAHEVHRRLRGTEDGVVNLDDLCSATAFRAFLQFVYTGELGLIFAEEAFELYVIADRYNLEDLKKLCLTCKKEKIPGPVILAF